MTQEQMLKASYEAQQNLLEAKRTKLRAEIAVAEGELRINQVAQDELGFQYANVLAQLNQQKEALEKETKEREELKKAKYSKETK